VAGTANSKARGQFRRSPLYEHLKERGACFGSKMGWERANFFARPGPGTHRVRLGPSELASVGRGRAPGLSRGRRCLRHESFAKLLVQGPEARAALQWLVANEVPDQAGRTVYTGMLNRRGGYESDFTITCVDDEPVPDCHEAPGPQCATAT